jgi:hypothetical protein
MWDLWSFFSEYFGFPCQSFHRLLHTHHYPICGAGTVGQIVADVPSGLNVFPSQEKKLPYKNVHCDQESEQFVAVNLFLF